MSRATKACIAASVSLLILLIANYEFARKIYAYSFDPAYYAGCFCARGSDISPAFGYPEDRVGGVLAILLLASAIASVRLLKSDFE